MVVVELLVIVVVGQHGLYTTTEMARRGASEWGVDGGVMVARGVIRVNSMAVSSSTGGGVNYSRGTS